MAEVARAVPARSVLVAGAAGHLGGFVVSELCSRGLAVVALVRPGTPPARKVAIAGLRATVLEADAAAPGALNGACEGVDAVVSCLAGGLRDIWAVDRGGSIALFEEAARAGARSFVVVATFEGREARGVSMLARAKEEAVDFMSARAAAAGMFVFVIRPTAYFKDFTDYPWASVRDRGGLTFVGPRGRDARYNPIHGADLSAYIADLIADPSAAWHAPCAEPLRRPPAGAAAAAAAEPPVPFAAEPLAHLVTQHPIGGPEPFTLPGVAALAAVVRGRDPSSLRIRRIPPLALRPLAWAAALLAALGWQRAGALSAGLEFVLFGCAHDSLAPSYGRRTVRQHFEQLLSRERAREAAAGAEPPGG